MDLESKRALIVEDEGLIAMVVEAYLEDLGYTVLAIAAQLEEGMEAAREAAIDIAVLDVNLAGKVSYPIAEILLERGIPFLFATGYGTAGCPPEFRATPVVAKPFSKEDLAKGLVAAGGAGPSPASQADN